MKYIYNVDTENKKVICVTRYAGASIRGIAKCHEDDIFDVETGKFLAKLRCDTKIAKIRCKRAKARFEKSVVEALKAKKIEEYFRVRLEEELSNFEEADYACKEFESKLTTD